MLPATSTKEQISLRREKPFQIYVRSPKGKEWMGQLNNKTSGAWNQQKLTPEKKASLSIDYIIGKEKSYSSCFLIILYIY